MAIFEYVKEKYNTPEDMFRLIQYAREKTSSVNSPNMLCFSTEILYHQFLYTRNYFRKTSGTLLLHYILSFDSVWERDITTNTMCSCAYHICTLLPEYQSVFFLHPKSGQYHLHILVNPVSTLTGKKLHMNENEFDDFLKSIAYWITELYKVALLGYTYFDQNGNCRKGKQPKEYLYMNKPGTFSC